MPARKPKPRPCVDCGAIKVCILRTDRPVYCTDCAIKRAILGAQQMAAKSGPAWDKWLASKDAWGRTRGDTNPKG